MTNLSRYGIAFIIGLIVATAICTWKSKPVAVVGETIPELVGKTQEAQVRIDTIRITEHTVTVEPMDVHRETKQPIAYLRKTSQESIQGYTSKAIQQWSNVSMWSISAKDWAEELQYLPCYLYEKLEKVTPTKCRTKEKIKLQELRQSILEKRETPTYAMHSVWRKEIANASSRLQQTIARCLVVSNLPFRYAQIARYYRVAII